MSPVDNRNRRSPRRPSDCAQMTLASKIRPVESVPVLGSEGGERPHPHDRATGSLRYQVDVVCQACGLTARPLVCEETFAEVWSSCMSMSCPQCEVVAAWQLFWHTFEAKEISVDVNPSAPLSSRELSRISARPLAGRRSDSRQRRKTP
jgi:hypothetical protein